MSHVNSEHWCYVLTIITALCSLHTQACMHACTHCGICQIPPGHRGTLGVCCYCLGQGGYFREVTAVYSDHYRQLALFTTYTYWHIYTLLASPFGGSLVTLTEFCSTLTGKALVGIELR